MGDERLRLGTAHRKRLLGDDMAAGAQGELDERRARMRRRDDADHVARLDDGLRIRDHVRARTQCQHRLASRLAARLNRTLVREPARNETIQHLQVRGQYVSRSDEPDGDTRDGHETTRVKHHKPAWISPCERLATNVKQP